MKTTLKYSKKEKYEDIDNSNYMKKRLMIENILNLIFNLLSSLSSNIGSSSLGIELYLLNYPFISLFSVYSIDNYG